MIIESNSAPITNLSIFIIEKVTATNLTSITVKKLKDQTLLVEVEKIFYGKWQFHNISVKT